MRISDWSSDVCSSDLIVTPTSMATSQAMMRDARSSAPSRPCCSSAPENMGTKAVLNAPSAKRRRNRLGKRKAAKKASAAGQVPSTRQDKHRVGKEWGCTGRTGGWPEHKKKKQK